MTLQRLLTAVITFMPKKFIGNGLQKIQTEFHTQSTSLN